MASKGLLVFTLLLAAAFVVNCARQEPQPNEGPAADPNSGGGYGKASGLRPQAKFGGCCCSGCGGGAAGCCCSGCGGGGAGCSKQCAEYPPPPSPCEHPPCESGCCCSGCNGSGCSKQCAECPPPPSPPCEHPPCKEGCKYNCCNRCCEHGESHP